MADAPVVLLTALNHEYTAMARQLANSEGCFRKRTRFDIGTVRGTSCPVVLGLTGKGNGPAAVLAERAVDEFAPVAVLFVGVAGALWDATALGDVVIGTHVYGYHGGTSEDDGFKARPRVWEVDHALHQIAAHVDRAADWTDQLGPKARMPQVHFGAIAAGEVVHNSRISHEAQQVREHYNDALAVEMESAGMAQAGHLNGVPVATIRGISDHADGTKTSNQDADQQPHAATNAAAFAARLAVEINQERENIAMSHEHPQETGPVFHNSATEVVGLQGSIVTGSTVAINAHPRETGPSDLTNGLASVRRQLDQAHTRGDLDNETYEDAKEEIDTAIEKLNADPAQNRNAVVRGLRKLSGLLSGVTDIAATITALITTANGLS